MFIKFKNLKALLERLLGITPSILMVMERAPSLLVR